MTGQIVKHVCDSIKCYEDIGWCHVLLPPSGRGLVIVASSYGTWSYSWRHFGEQSIASFLEGCDCEYLGKKFLGDDAWQFDSIATIAEIKRYILQSRRDGYLDKSEARYEWTLWQTLERGEISYVEWRIGTNIEDCFEPRRRQLNSSWRFFWDRLWEPHVRPALRELR